MKICPHAAADAAQTDGIDDPPPMAHIETGGGRVRQGQKEARGAPRQRYRRRRKSGMLHFSAAVSSGAQAPEGAAIDGEYTVDTLLTHTSREGPRGMGYGGV